ncbi:ABC transporter substrate-binding protein [Dictyobacter vulcani]|uniref:ABC transporter substrate-binding protein n=1 Tax=Dictyobacter vulcani TaxID=2607529 RepID=A0A5J4KWK4_9CHLR|nr:zinc ABC transporter substrate-binding protein [Dictyobacter vulcani]GER90910.1 ABC transporter substrate-binding protein [Dictyobacter vulcani]
MRSGRNKQAALCIALMALFLLSACGSHTGLAGTSSTQGSNTISVVAAENFYGSIVRQIGGKHVSVTSMLADPNVDPHSYESNVDQVKAVARAQLVIANGGGYDDWMDKLLSSTPSSERKVIKGFDVAPNKLPDNEHVWYSPDNAKNIASAIADTLKTLDTAHAAEYAQNLIIFERELSKINQKMDEIRSKYANAPVGLTETILRYQTGPMGLRVLTPDEFQKALAEGNDPPANTVITAENQINQRQIKVFIYNQQTQSAITTKLMSDARARNIPVVPVTETMPPDQTYQSWMLTQLEKVEQALASNK